MGNPSLKGQMWREMPGVSRVPWSLMWTDMDMNIVNMLAEEYNFHLANLLLLSLKNRMELFPQDN